MKKNLSCFCYFCLDGNFLACENVPWTKEWEVEILVPSNTTFVHEVMLDVFDEDDWDQFGENGDHLTSYFALGDNFSLNAKEGIVEGVDFYILMCTIHYKNHTHVCGGNSSMLATL
jgi:hypothetical protein